jgi:CzcA family heavy metal efflux pump
MKSPVAWAARRAALVWMMALGLAAGGVVIARRLPSGIYPEVEFPRIQVVARGGDAPPEVTQMTLARPLETELATVMGLERIRSRTIRGAAELSLLFAPGADMWRALQLVESRLGEVRGSLPAGVEVTAERLTTGSFPVVTFNLSGAIDARRLRETADLVLRPALSRVRGVGRVDVLGGDVREVEVVLDPARAAALRLRPADVAERLRAHAVLAAVGRVDEAHQLVTVVASAEPRTLDDLRALPVAMGPDGSPVRLAAVATVEEGAEDRLTRVGGPDGETVLISVGRLPGASTPDVVERVRAAAAASSLPAGVKLTVVYDQAELVAESMRSVRDAILAGILLCVAVIALFLRNLRAGLVAALAVPLTLGATFLIMAAAGETLNLMSLGGMAVAIGLVIDDAIVVVEAIGRRLEEGASPAEAAEEGTRAMFAAVLGTTATTVVVFIPLGWLPGVVGRFSSALAITVSAAVVVSFVVALVVIPVAAARWLPARARPPSHRGGLYGRLLAATLNRRWLGLLLVAGLLGLGVLAAVRVPTGFLPSMDEGAFVLDYFLPAGTSLGDTDAVARRIERILHEDADVLTFSRRTGAELGPVAATEISRGDIMVRLRAKTDGRTRDLDDVISGLRARVAAEVPEARTEFLEVLQDVLNDLAGTPRPIELKLLGEDYAVLRELAREVAARIKDVPGLVDLFPGFEGDAPELRLRIDPLATARLGRTPADVAADLETALRGVVAGSMRRFDRLLGVRVRYPDEVRFDAVQVQALPLSFGSGLSIAAVATPERVGTPASLERENLSPVVIVTADREGRDLGAVMADVRKRLAGLRLPEGYRLELGGQYQGQRESFSDLGRVMAFGLVAVLVVMLAQFRRWRFAIIIFLSAPLAIVGAVATLWAVNVPLNASSLMGCVLLIGLVVKNGILLLEHAERRLDDGLSLREALVAAGQTRVRPVLMTTVATLAGLAPLALGLGSGAELQRPLAVAVIGGLVVSTAVSLLVLPSLVMWLGKREGPERGGSPALAEPTS